MARLYFRVSRPSLLKTLLAFCCAACMSSTARAQLSYVPVHTESGTILIIRGQFEPTDTLDDFFIAIKTHNPKIISFDSPGGNPLKAMEIGRAIRLLELPTFQLRKQDCASACSLAFLGGTIRFAEPGSIGVHRSSFATDHQISSDNAVAAIQMLTAQMMSYIASMGAKPEMLELALKYESKDMRYLSMSEMETYNIVTREEPASTPTAQTAPPPQAPSAPTSSLAPDPVAARPTLPQAPLAHPIPTARTGIIQHPKGFIALKSYADSNAPDGEKLATGTPVNILSSEERWFRIRAGHLTGYIHHSWAWVREFNVVPYGMQAIQIKSFNNQQETMAFIKAAPFKVDAYFTTNGWYTITLKGYYTREKAIQIVRAFKKDNLIPQDSIFTNGNTYALKMCCQ